MPVKMRNPVETLLDSMWERFGSGGEAERLSRARALISAGEPAQALDLLNRLLGAAEGGGRMAVVVEVLAVKALVLRELGDDQGAMSAIARALSFGEREGYVNVFVGEGAPMATLLSEFVCRQRGGLADVYPSVPPEYVGMLLAMLRVRAALPDNLLASESSASRKRRVADP